MFIVSFKKLKKFFTFLLIAILCGSLILFAVSKKQNAACANKTNVSANDNNSRILFFKECGLEVTSDPIEETEITIPSTFNSTYSSYNEMQKSQGFDLSKYMGKRCQKYTYQILNYDSSSTPTKANILIYKNKVIAGDIFRTGSDGFIKPIINKG